MLSAGRSRDFEGTLLKKWITRRRQNIMKKALITGITGQDGSFLAEL